ncbi:glycosyltransferase, CESA-like subfamily [Citrifermentans bemidjiense Bem]|uniref:Glycosyltransferase, CESA-like subfamily n=1 Tax=Citrifermentans bemidjiense (strain ATCC BAA-1014 / DSM 16622 / JCM 12645 / Bem) TaxID=404380 RepID=B5EA87_CITBB|nr:glycosyltransferase family 2 protein [Citrifermentans bemidjiense]ACH38793.1 glycosyltransferase, CESA-like subfamily [Citrifermentans bemidjiense Bem]
MVWTEITMIALLLLLAYIYLGYPLLLCLLARLIPTTHRTDDGFLPTVTLVISAYNEKGVIRAKLENSLALDYPQERLSILVVSDCSSDGTDTEVLSFSDKGVKLMRAEERRGKTSAINTALACVDSEMVVFSDANAIYDATAIRRLVRHFVDPSIGYVVGCARYVEETVSAAGGSESTYWDLEVMLKRWESRLSSVVGGDGAIYAIRRSLYEPLKEEDINDFVNPLQIVAKGYRGVFDEEAWCVERPAGEFHKEFSRKVRIVNRSFSGFLRVPRAANPMVTGAFAWQLVSHKLLRWFSPCFLGLFFVFLVLNRLLYSASLTGEVLLTLTAMGAFISMLGALLNRFWRVPLPLLLPYYFVLVNTASALGVFYRLLGRTIVTWSTVREGEAAPPPAPLLPRLALLCVAVLLVVTASGVALDEDALGAAAILLMLLLVHTFVGYQLLLLPLSRLSRRKPARDESYTPMVTLLVVAYNEAKVIEKKLLNSLELEYPSDRLRILVASDGSKDGTDEIVSRFLDRGVELISFPGNRGKISALNDAMRQINSDIVVLSDANVYYMPNAIRKLVRNFADPEVGAVSGRVVLINDSLSYSAAEKSYYSIEHLIQELEGSLGALIGADGAMYAIRRQLFTPPSPDTILDDLVIAMGIARQGHLVMHEKEALGFEENLLEIVGEFRRKVRIIAGGYQCLLRGDVIPRLSQPLLMFCFTSHKLLRWVSGYLLVALVGVLVQIQLRHSSSKYALVLAALLVALVLALLVQLFPRMKSLKIASLCHYFYMLMAASLLGGYRGVTGRQKVTWRGGTA